MTSPQLGTPLNPDIGARTVSDQVTLSEARLENNPHVNALAFAERDTAVVIAAGDGWLWRMPLAEGPDRMYRLAGLGAMPLFVAGGVADGGVLVGTDSGSVVAVTPDGATSVCVFSDGGWAEKVAVDPSGRTACSLGKRVIVLDGSGATLVEYDDHPSTVTGLAFSADGTLLACSHYGGITLWQTNGGAPERLSWHGSHTAVTWSPDGRFIVSAMQENELHSWRMPERKSLRMSGYPAKIRSMSWTSDSRFLAVSGADTVTSWDFTGNGPSGRAPEEFGYVFNCVVTQVAAHPKTHVVAGGYNDGTVLIGHVTKGDAIIARGGDGAPITQLLWTPDGEMLIAATATGTVATMSLRRMLT
jgi:WD40 repeat protein